MLYNHARTQQTRAGPHHAGPVRHYPGVTRLVRQHALDGRVTLARHFVNAVVPVGTTAVFRPHPHAFMDMMDANAHAHHALALFARPHGQPNVLRAHRAAIMPVVTRNVPAPTQALPHLSVFGGSSTRLADWFNQADTKLDRDGAAIGGDLARFQYLSACLTPAVRLAVTGPLGNEPKNPRTLGEKLIAMFGVSKGDLHVYESQPSVGVQKKWQRENRCTGCGSWMHSAKMCPQTMTENDARLVRNRTSASASASASVSASVSANASETARKRRRCDHEDKGKEVSRGVSGRATG
ncbi:hypothetical protein OQA88_10705 [Cercophora sp. LCS_1]